MRGNGGVDDESTMEAVLVKDAIEDRIVTIGTTDRSSEIVNHRAGGHTPEEFPGVFEALDQIRQLLRMGDVDVLVTAVDEGDHESVQHPSTLQQAVPNQPQPSEIHLGQLARSDIGHSNGRPLRTKPAVLDREAIQRGVGDFDAATTQQIVTLGQRQRMTVLRVTLQPRSKRLAVLKKKLLRFSGRIDSRPGTQLCQHSSGQAFVRLDGIGSPA
jgi:hypothetical protein